MSLVKAGTKSLVRLHLKKSARKKPMAKKKATEDQFNELHNLVTSEFLQRIKSGEATTQDLKAACDWLAKNDISGVAYEGNPLDKLATVMPKIDPEMVQKRLYGSKNF